MPPRGATKYVPFEITRTSLLPSTYDQSVFCAVPAHDSAHLFGNGRRVQVCYTLPQI
jgi:hypothetical protein